MGYGIIGGERPAPVVVIAAIALGFSPALADDWHQFRGPNGDGISLESPFADLDTFGLSVAWKKPLGSGYSGVAVAGGHVVTMFSDGESDFVVAMDERSGRERWRFDLGPTYTGHDGSHSGPISTPLIDGKHVFALGPRGRLYGLDLDTGKKIWSTHLVDDHGCKKPDYGFGTSPILVDGVLVVQIGAEEGAVAGFDPASGKRLWASASGPVSYQSPIPYRVGGEVQILAVTDEHLYGIDPQSGRVAWEYAHEGNGVRGVASLTPVPAGGERLFLAHRDNESRLVDIQHGGDSISASTVWENRAIRNSYTVAVYHDGHVYAYSSRFLICVDANTGESVWRSRRPGDGFLMLVDGHLVILTKKGSVHVVGATPAGYHEVAALQVFDDLAWSAPGFADGAIFVRGLDAMARVNIVPGGAASVVPSEVVRVPADSAFGRFLAEVQSTSDKKAVIDRFMASNQFPVTDAKGWIHFVYRGRGSDLAVAGDLFGARQERSLMRIEGTDFFHYSAPLEADARVNYLLIRDYEEILDPLNSRKTTTIMLGKDMEMSFNGEEMDMSWVSMPGWKLPGYLKGVEPAARGSIETHELESATLEKKHSVDVYLPAGYKAGDQRYPVAYVHGGRPAIDQGHLPEALDRLIGKSVAPTIVVFIHHLPFGDTESYAKMVAEELIPFIDKKYRTVDSPDARASLGMGMGGFAALYCAFHDPELTGKVATHSAFLFDMMMTGFDALIDGPDKKSLQVYMDWGKYDMRNPHENWDIADSNRKFARKLRQKGYPPAGGEVHDGTGWSSWRNRTGTVFELFFPLSDGR